MMTIDKQLKDIIDRYVAIARVTFASDQPDERIIRNTVLLFLAGKGLAAINPSMVLSPTWVATDALIQAELDPAVGSPIPSNLLRKKATTTAETSNEPRMMSSLRIIMADMLDPVRGIQIKSSEPDQSPMDRLLLMLAGTRQAILMSTDDGDQVWMASPKLIEEHHRRASANGYELRMDDVLAGYTKCWEKLFNAVCSGVNPGPEVTKLATLATYELAGDAIAYRDFDGKMAWKASDHLRKDLDEHDDDDEEDDEDYDDRKDE